MIPPNSMVPRDHSLLIFQQHPAEWTMPISTNTFFFHSFMLHPVRLDHHAYLCPPWPLQLWLNPPPTFHFDVWNLSRIPFSFTSSLGGHTSICFKYYLNVDTFQTYFSITGLSQTLQTHSQLPTQCLPLHAQQTLPVPSPESPSFHSLS